MVGITTSIIALLAGLPPAEMADVVAARLQELDKLAINLTVETHAGMTGTPMLDPASWGQPHDTCPYKLAILHPNLRMELLKDDPSRGYEPVDAALVDGVYVSRHVRPFRVDGRTLYTVANEAVDSGVMRREALQAFGLGFFHCAPPWALNVADVLRDESAVLVRSTGGVSTYAASVRMDRRAYTIHFDMDINEAGVPLRVRTIADFDQAGTPDACAEQFLVRTEEIDGVEVPVETIITLWGLPDHWGVSVVRVSQAGFQRDLSLDDIRIDVERRNAHVSEHFGDGRWRTTVYNATGEVISEQSFEPPGVSEASRASPWRMAVPPLAIVVALGTAGLLAHVSRSTAR